MDAETYALLKKKIDKVSLAYEYKGSVATFDALPSNATKGDLYTIGTYEYVYDGAAWVELSTSSISREQIDQLFD